MAHVTTDEDAEPLMRAAYNLGVQVLANICCSAALLLCCSI